MIVKRIQISCGDSNRDVPFIFLNPGAIRFMTEFNENTLEIQTDKERILVEIDGNVNETTPLLAHNINHCDDNFYLLEIT